MLKLDKICVSFRSERQDKIFGHTKQQILFDVSVEVKKGTCLGILGESGSGKSTMGRVLCGLLKPDSGNVLINDVPVYASKSGRRELQNKLSIVFQDYTTSANPRFRVRDILKEGLYVRQRKEQIRLDQEKDDDLSEQRPMDIGVVRNQPGYAGRGSGGKKCVNIGSGLSVARGERQHQ